MPREPSQEHPTESVPIADLKPHPRNYKKHPPEQVRHLAASLRQFGQYRNVVIARDGTILAGHGVVEAIRSLRWEAATCVRLDLEPSSPKALKLVALDNEVPKLSESDDRALGELLREVAGSGPEELLGTGYDEERVDALLREFRTRDEARLPEGTRPPDPKERVSETVIEIRAPAKLGQEVLSRVRKLVEEFPGVAINVC